MSSSIDFAYDRPDAAQQQALAAAICASHPSWAVLDLALLDATTLHRRMQRNRWTHYNAYAASSLAAFAEHAVWLVALDTEPAAHAKQIATLLNWTAGTPALSFLYGVAEPAQLQALAGYLAKIAVEERKQPLHCRFADTRVLPGLLRQLDAAQRSRVQQAIEDWGWIDRHAAYARWQPAPGAVAADSAAHLRLSAAQFRALRAPSDADAIFVLLLEQTPSLVPAERRGQFHARLCAILETADSYRVHDPHSRLQFVVLSMTCGEGFHRLHALADTWAGVQAGEHTLAEHMPLWDSKVWEQLDADPPRHDGSPFGEQTA
ncbi:DUF4123 domain-containing protein [Xanthomonas translucens pv. translucens]|nr:DUF4123 domain-containing protein [Xanthomonas translucens pv. translucens]